MRLESTMTNQISSLCLTNLKTFPLKMKVNKRMEIIRIYVSCSIILWKAPSPPLWLLLGSPILVDPHPGQHHPGLSDITGNNQA